MNSPHRTPRVPLPASDSSTGAGCETDTVPCAAALRPCSLPSAPRAACPGPAASRDRRDRRHARRAAPEPSPAERRAQRIALAAAFAADRAGRKGALPLHHRRAASRRQWLAFYFSRISAEILHSLSANLSHRSTPPPDHDKLVRWRGMCPTDGQSSAQASSGHAHSYADVHEAEAREGEFALNDACEVEGQLHCRPANTP